MLSHGLSAASFELPLWSSQSHYTLRSTETLLTRVNRANCLRPADITALICLGDSLLAGLCLSHSEKSLKNKCLSWLAKKKCCFPWLHWTLGGEHKENTCISGGSSSILSVGQLLRLYSPDIQGLSPGPFNFATSGATCEHLRRQILRLDQLIQKQPRLKSEWKLVFIWIGANDVLRKSKTNIEQTYESFLLQSLQLLKTRIPRCMVCLLTLPDISCASHDPITSVRIKEKTELINHAFEKVVNLYDWDSDDFRLVLVPIPNDNIAHSTYLEFVSPIDRIHPNLLAHQLFSKCIWNNLFLPEKKKLRTFQQVLQAEWLHPAETDFFQ